MARYSFGMRATIAGTSTLPAMSIFSAAGSGFKLVEVGIYNTTTTAAAIALARLTAQGTVGAAQTEAEYDNTVAATIGQILRQATIGAAAGAGVIWTFGNGGIVVPSGTANGLGIIVPTGTGQVCDIEFTWDE
jgi:hypothetical protein